MGVTGVRGVERDADEERRGLPRSVDACLWTLALEYAGTLMTVAVGATPGTGTRRTDTGAGVRLDVETCT